MNHDFDVFVKDHLQAVLCQAEKEHALSSIRKTHVDAYKSPQRKSPHHHANPVIQLQDCAISPSFSNNHL